MIEEMGLVLPVYSFMRKNGTQFLWLEMKVLLERKDIMEKEGYVQISQVIEKL